MKLEYTVYTRTHTHRCDFKNITVQERKPRNENQKIGRVGHP